MGEGRGIVAVVQVPVPPLGVWSRGGDRRGEALLAVLVGVPVLVGSAM